MDEAEAVAMLGSFVPDSGCIEWREVIGERVGRWFGRSVPGTSIVDQDNFGFEWVEGEDAQEVLEHSRRSGGSAPYSLFSFLDGFQVLTPCLDFPAARLPRASVRARLHTVPRGAAAPPTWRLEHLDNRTVEVSDRRGRPSNGYI